MNLKINSIVHARAALSLLPSDIQRSLLDENSFLSRCSIETTIALTLGKDGPIFLRNEFYDGIRRAICRQGDPLNIVDKRGASWQIFVELHGGGLVFSIRSDSIKYILADHSALAEDSNTRTGWLNRLHHNILFDDAACDRWMARLHESPLDDDEFVLLMADIEDSPSSVFRILKNNFEQMDVNVATLVPHALRYYERLIGRLEQASTVVEYIEAGAKPLIVDLQRRNTSEGFKYALLMCSTGAITKCIEINEMCRSELIQTYQWLADHGDPVSRLGAVEVALSQLDIFPELSPFVEQIVEYFLSDDPEEDGGIFCLLSASIVLAASELARKCTLGNIPPFYRKQAAIAHASLVIRAINAAGVDVSSFTQWAQSLGIGHIYFLQGLIDLRDEPRWLPDFVAAAQLRFEFIGRILNAVGQNEAKIQTDSLRSLLVGPNSKMALAAKWPCTCLPGPLEGEILFGRILPENLALNIKIALRNERLDVTSFAGLVNSALLFDMERWTADLAEAALRRVRFSIDDSSSENNPFSLIVGLVILAAVTRSTNLAETLRVLTRVMRQRRRLSGNLDDEMRIALIAAASFENIDDWAKFAGDWLTEMAFETKDKDAASKLLLTIRRLVNLEPALARYCAMADAALDAFTR